MKTAPQTSTKISRLREIFEGKTSLLIVMQDNPDPDSIAAAVALRKLANSFASISCSIAHGGRVGRAENRALVKYLSLNLHQCSKLDFTKYDLIAMVDTQPGTGNNSLPPGILPHIVIDHHPIHKVTRSCQFTDIRKTYGATSTIFCEYLREAQIPIDTSLATALLYAIRSDTQDLGRQAIKADVDAIGLLFPLANKRMLSNIQRGSLQREYFYMLSDALQNARVYGDCIVTSLEHINNPDMVGEVADLFLRDDETHWTFCYGFFEGKLLISVRTSVEDARADLVMKKVVARRGTGGGHESYAGGQIPLKEQSKKKMAALEKEIVTKFLQAVGVDDKQPQKLLAQ